MNFDWLNYLELAKTLAGPSSTGLSGSDLIEAKLRCAISRAYYAAYCKCRNYLRDIDGDKKLKNPNQLPGAHTYVINEFKYRDKSNKKRVEIGTDLDRLFTNRKRADYDDTFGRLESEARFALKLAESIITKLEELP